MNFKPDEIKNKSDARGRIAFIIFWIFISALAIVLIIGLWKIGNYSSDNSSASENFPDEAKVISLLSTADEKYTIGSRTQTTDCDDSHINGSSHENFAETFPNLNCSPGAIFENATVQDICKSGYSSSVRNVTISTKAEVYAEYGLTYPQETGAYEADHLISLELGGSNDIANLWPEAAEPMPGFHEKDIVENYLHDEVCTGRVNLSAAQKQIANDWLAVYNAMKS